MTAIETSEDGAERTTFSCRGCGHRSKAWSARCSQCSAWASTAEPGQAKVQDRSPSTRSLHSKDVELRLRRRVEPAMATADPGSDRERNPPESTPVPITEVNVSDRETRIVTGIEPLDRVLGGGLVIGSMVLLGGEPGSGKSTLLMQMMAAATRDRVGLYATGEESISQVAMRAHRVEAALPSIELVRETDLDSILWHARNKQARIVVVDSIHTIRSSEESGLPGSDYQVKVCGQALMKFAKDTGVVVVIVAHVNKDGDISGPMNFEHAGDATLMLSVARDLGEPWRELRGIKNRFGSTAEVGMFQMAEKGLLPIASGTEPDRADRERDQLEPVAQELLHRYLELGGIVDDGLRDRIAGRLDLTTRSKP